jgi:hypothetical protein
MARLAAAVQNADDPDTVPKWLVEDYVITVWGYDGTWVTA